MIKNELINRKYYQPITMACAIGGEFWPCCCFKENRKRNIYAVVATYISFSN